MMLTTSFKDWAGTLAPIASASAAVTAIVVSLWVANKQRRIQESQRQQSLYDKRYAIYLAVEEIVMYVLRTNGSVDLLGEEYRRYQYAAEQAVFLFNEEITAFVNDIKKKVSALYVKSSKRDNLARMGQQNDDLNIQISEALQDFAGPILEGRRNLFGPYLQLSPGATPKSGAKMRLNGWQRLWVVIIVAGLTPALWLAHELWPTAADMSNFDVFTRMNPEDARRLADYSDVLAAHYGGYRADSSPGTPQGPVMDVEAHTLQFIAGASRSDMNRTADSFSATLRRLLLRERIALAGEVLVWWALPSIALYLLGWAVAWIRRGFAGTP